MFDTMKSSIFYTVFFLALALSGCRAQPINTPPILSKKPAPIITGAEQMNVLLPLLQNKRVALLVNQTAVVGQTHLADTLLASGVAIQKIFAPEHGFRGKADAGSHIQDNIDLKTQLRVISLYGAKKKPSATDLSDVDAVIFDIQDVGARFYTFISSLRYLMEACAENNKLLIVLDRPNPNGWYVDGPVLKKDCQSFVGVDPIPVVHGLTVGEYAQMVNGEKWLSNGIQCTLAIVPCKNYEHNMRYSLPIHPSPNLPNSMAIYNYPSICYFEGTDISVGRGTDAPFQLIGAPKITDKQFSFTPVSKPGAGSPPHMQKLCYGYDLRNADTTIPGINLSYLLKAYKTYADTAHFFLPNLFFDKLAGTTELRKQIIAGKNETEIKASWESGLNLYKATRKKYLLYKDFE